MIINTTPGKSYAVTTAVDCTVSTPDGVLITSCPAGEQTLFIAPCAEVEVSDDAALVTKSFKGAPAGLSAAGGLSDRQAQAVGEMVEASLNDTVTEPHTTAIGSDNANFKWCQFAPTRILAGTMAAISMPCRTTASSLITTSPVYLSVFQLNEGGEYEYAGTSENAVVQAIGQTSRWTFRRLQLTGRTLRLCPVPDTSTKWTDKLVLGGRVAPVSGEDSKITPISGSGAYVAEAVLEYAHQEPKYAKVPVVENHVSDTTAHITEEERTKWNAKQDAETLNGAVDARLRDLGQVYLNLSVKNVRFPGSGGSEKVRVYTNSLDGVTSIGPGFGWLMMEQPVVNGVFACSVGANDCAYERKTTCKVKAGNLTATITVVQEAGELLFTVNQTKFPLEAGVGEIGFTITHNASGNPSITSKPDWLTSKDAIQQEQMGNKKKWSFAFDAAANEQTAERTGEIVVSLNGQSLIVTVTQDGTPTSEQPTE